MSWWLKTKAAAAYVLLPNCSDKQSEANAHVCAACPTLTVYEEQGAATFGWLWESKPYTGFCGGSPDDGDPIPGESCRCMVLAEVCPGQVAHVTVRGRPMRAAGKSEKVLQTCPQGRWKSVQW